MAQDVSAAWTAEERDSYRSIAHNLLVSWKKESTLGAVTFTIGVSTIGGNDIIGVNPGTIGSPGIYKYFDESSYVKNMAWEYKLKYPIGGLSVGFAEATLDNTSGRFLPEYMGGVSELYTAILPRRPVIMNGGFNLDGIDQTIPQFSGVLRESPRINVASREVQLSATDYVDFFANRFLDQEVMFTGLTTDAVYEQLLLSMGLSTAQYQLDPGISIIPFGLFDKGTSYYQVFNDLAEAENGQFYQDEEGKFRFENRQHWDSSPHNQAERIIPTSQVIDAEAPNNDNIINVVEVKSEILKKQPEQQIFKLSTPLQLDNGDTEYWINFEDPVLELNSTFFFVANSLEDASGTDTTSNITVKRYDLFSKALKVTFTNSSTTTFLTDLVLYGRVVRKVADVYVRRQDDSSVTAYEERPITIENKYIQNLSWAESYAQMILNDYSEPDNIQTITIRAIPELQRGDLISWQGRSWRVYGIRTRLGLDGGYVQDLIILQRSITSYFIIGVSTIGGTDQIAP